MLGAVGVGLAVAIVVTLLTTPLYRSWVTLEVNPPAVEIMRRANHASSDSQSTNTFDFVATQVGLLEQPSVAERTAQELNLANNPDVRRRRMATPRSACGPRPAWSRAASRS